MILYTPLSDKKKFTVGVLSVTTFKLSFASPQETVSSNCYQQNLLLGLNDVCLSSIDTIYQIGDRTKKRLAPGQNINGKVKDLLIVCKVIYILEINSSSTHRTNFRI